MDEPLHHIDDLFFHELEGYQEAPSARVWDEVNAELGQPAAPPAPAAPVRSFWYLKAAMILLMMVTGYALNRHTHEKVTAFKYSADQYSDDKTGPESSKAIIKAAASQDPNNNGKDHPVAADHTVTTKAQPEKAMPGTVALKTARIRTEHSTVISKGQVYKHRSSIGNDITAIPYETSKPQALVSDQHKTKADPVAVNNKEEKARVYQQQAADAIVSNDPSASKDDNTAIERSTAGLNAVPLTLVPVVQPYAFIGKTAAHKQISDLKAVSLRSAPKPIRISNPHQISLTASFAPDLTWSRLSDEEEHRPGSWGGRPHEDHHDIRENEKAGFAYTAGARVQVSLGKHFSLGSGLTYSASNTKQEPKKLYADHDDNGEVRYRLNCSAGYAYLLPETAPAPAVGDSILMDRSNYNVQYLNIPVFAGYTFGKGRITTSIIGGTQFNVLLKGKSSAVLQQNVNSKTTVATPIQGLKKITTDMLAGLSFDYRIAPQFSLSLSPMSRISLTPINQSGAVTSRPGALSIAAGVRYFF